LDRSPHLLVCILLFVFLILGGTLGYMFIEQWPFADAIYMTAITLSTVGFSEVKTLSSVGRIFTMVLIISGVSFVFYVLGSVLQFMMEGHIRRILGRRKLEKEIRGQKGHYIICGYGRVGTSICDALASRPQGIVVMERDSERIAKLDDRNLLYVAGEATEEENLIEAGVRSARGLVAALKTDSDNVYVTLTARQLNPELFIIARAGERKSESKLRAAGANKVVSPYNMGAHRIAQMILLPQQCKAIPVENIDLAIIPGVAFDERGGRIGHGTGFYDKFIPGLDVTTRKVALAFECQIVSQIPMEPHDRYIDIIITEERIIYKI